MKRERDGQTAIAILAKAPVAGLTKTRLIPHLGADGAAALQDWLLRRTVNCALAADLGPVTLWCAPDIEHPAFAACSAGNRLELRRQPEGDLGARMHSAISTSPTHGGTLVIGTDCAMLTPDLLRQAADGLRRHDATLIPAEDGGYVLIGLCAPQAQVFAQVTWSTSQVLDQTRARLDGLGLSWIELPTLWDVDRAADFQRLAAAFPDLHAIAAARTPA